MDCSFDKEKWSGELGSGPKGLISRGEFQNICPVAKISLDDKDKAPISDLTCSIAGLKKTDLRLKMADFRPEEAEFKPVGDDFKPLGPKSKKKETNW